jgi:hypothetical protein
MNTRKKVAELVRGYVRANMPEDLRRLSRLARFDVEGWLYAEQDDCEAPYPGFETAIDTVKAWLRDNVASELWVDLDCEMVFDRAPEGYYDGDEWIEPRTEDVYQVERRDIMRAAFGELGPYL